MKKANDVVTVLEDRAVELVLLTTGSQSTVVSAAAFSPNGKRHQRRGIFAGQHAGGVGICGQDGPAVEGGDGGRYGHTSPWQLQSYNSLPLAVVEWDKGSAFPPTHRPHVHRGL